MWQYIGYKSAYNAGFDADKVFYYWSNAGGGGSDVAWYKDYPGADWVTDMPHADATIEYGELDNYNGDIIALMDDWNITRESL